LICINRCSINATRFWHGSSYRGKRSRNEEEFEPQRREEHKEEREEEEKKKS
jgi:hypothetical protein